MGLSELTPLQVSKDFMRNESRAEYSILTKSELCLDLGLSCNFGKTSDHTTPQLFWLPPAGHGLERFVACASRMCTVISIVIAGSWEDGYGLKGAKWGSERVVPISTRVATELATVIEESEYQEPMDLVFTGFKRGVPLDKHMIEERFYSALEAFGINKAARRQRGLVWHSTRHTFNSLMRGRVDAGKLMQIVGHRQEATNILYTHVLPEDLVAVRAVQEGIFS